MTSTVRPQSEFSVSVSHPSDDAFGGGVRAFFENRDLGIKEATNGAYNFQVVRARPGPAQSTGWHYHPLNIQVLYCLGGWEEIAFEDSSLVRLVPGTCVNIPPGYGHNELAYSSDLEILVFFGPSEFVTVNIPEPPGCANLRLHGRQP
jgi:quercetin dioxygenase-like cupin family protein